MKIAIITSMNLPVPAFRGGAVENLIDMYLAYNSRHTHHEFTVYTMEDEHHLDGTITSDSYTKYVTINTQSRWYKLRNWIFRKTIGEYYSNGYWDFFLNECLGLIQKEDYDLIIVENRPEFVPRVKEVLGNETPVMFHMHNEFHSAMHRLPLAKKILAACDTTVCISQYISDVVHDNLAEAHTDIVFNGVDEKRFTNVTPARAEYGISDDDFVIAYSGRIREEKGVKELVQSLDYCSDIPNLKLLIIGGSGYGLDKEEAYMTEVRELTEKHADKVIVTGFLPYEKVPSVLANANLVIVPSLWDEPAALTAIEPQHLGIPMIVTQSGGMPEMTGDETAIIVEKDALKLPQLLADNIRLLYNDSERMARMSQACLNRSVQFTSGEYSHNMIRAMERCVENK